MGAIVRLEDKKLLPNTDPVYLLSVYYVAEALKYMDLLIQLDFLDCVFMSHWTF